MRLTDRIILASPLSGPGLYELSQGRSAGVGGAILTWGNRGPGLYTVGMVPPSMTYSVPVIDAARGEARNATRSATSLGCAGRPRGMPPSEFIRPLRAPS